MKTRTLKSRVVGGLAIIACATALHGQTYSLNQSKVAGGGGTSNGGGYSITGRIGLSQGVSANLGGNFLLTAGFGPLYAVEVPDAPLLTIYRTPTNGIVLSWPAVETGFALEQSSALGTAGWSTVTNAVQLVGVENQVILSPQLGELFYRLKK